MNGKTTLRTLWSIVQITVFILVLLLSILQMSGELMRIAHTVSYPNNLIEEKILVRVMLSAVGLLVSLFFLFQKSLVKRNIGLLVLLDSFLLTKWTMIDEHIVREKVYTAVSTESGCPVSYQFLGFQVATKEHLITYFMVFTAFIAVCHLVFIFKKQVLATKTSMKLFILILAVLIVTHIGLYYCS